MNWAGLPTVVRRTVDEAIAESGVPYRREGEPYQDGANVVVPVRDAAGDGRALVVVAPDGSAAVRAA